MAQSGSGTGVSRLPLSGVKRTSDVCFPAIVVSACEILARGEFPRVVVPDEADRKPRPQGVVLCRRVVVRSTPYAQAQDVVSSEPQTSPSRGALSLLALAWETCPRAKPDCKNIGLVKAVVFKEGESRGSSACETTRGNTLSSVIKRLAYAR